MVDHSTFQVSFPPLSSKDKLRRESSYILSMKENILHILIPKSVVDVFEFTTNPRNTHLWIDSIQQEIAEPYPPIVGTVYKNTSDGVHWDTYYVIGLEINNLFVLTDSQHNYHVQYTYRVIDEHTTEMEYREWMETGELANPFTIKTLESLKKVMDANV